MSGDLRSVLVLLITIEIRVLHNDNEKHVYFVISISPNRIAMYPNEYANKIFLK